MEGQTVEAHVTIFSIFFPDKIYTGSLVWPHGNQAKVFCVTFHLLFIFSFLCVAVIEDDFSFFLFTFLRGG
ncbi:hypothetical protein TCDM_10795 [Trypanosoma cruzi Dm28c]|uniref:Uncharacterized protein n=1 Tax=Trypanosoma cruzi Dm28c TaxID=1416333 RepID=V5B236_TRYCR|nr:hypothetical protein TCDM_10795 [Trypanosoma cruzi Dm28c]